MKKTFFLFILAISVLLLNVKFSYAADAPVYDPTFDNNSGGFFANGTEITIDIDDENNTVITWDEGSQIVPPTVTIFGGGNSGTSYDSANITMNNGEVMRISGGGLSTDAENPAYVTDSNITINGGTISSGVSGGGFLYAEVENANVTINNGIIGDVEGGGFASVSINGVWYTVGTEENPQASENRTENTNIIINDGKISSPSLNYGMVYGGGQGYSYVGNSTLKINGGDLSTTYVTAGGSNGYTGESNVEISGGDIQLYQSVNRGTVENAMLLVSGGNIDNVYVGGETGDATVTGTVGKSTLSLVEGTIGTLEPGKSNSVELTVDNVDYVVVKTDEIVIDDDKIPSGEVEVSYDISIEPVEVTILRGATSKLQLNITTEPTGYERMMGRPEWSSDNETIVSVDSNGVITGINAGEAVITATLNDKEATSNVTVEDTGEIIPVIIFAIGLFTIFILIIIIPIIFGAANNN